MDLMPLIEKLEIDGVGEKGKNLYLNMLPVEVSSAVLLRNSLNGTPIDYELVELIKSDFQLIVRSPSYPSGEELIKRVTNSLTFVEMTVGNYFFHYVRPRTHPVVFPLSNGNLLEFSTYFDVCCYKVIN